jgi:hypothetical protein
MITITFRITIDKNAFFTFVVYFRQHFVTFLKWVIESRFGLKHILNRCNKPSQNISKKICRSSFIEIKCLLPWINGFFLRLTMSRIWFCTSVRKIIDNILKKKRTYPCTTHYVPLLKHDKRRGEKKCSWLLETKEIVRLPRTRVMKIPRPLKFRLIC